MLISNNLYNQFNDNKRPHREVKPRRYKDDKQTFRSINQNLNLLKKRYNRNIDGLVKIISDNVVYTFFNTDSEQITELITQFINWPLEIIVKSFIINYYIPHKNDNMLKMFIMYNINKIAFSVVDIIEMNLIKGSNVITFNHDAFESQVELLRKQLTDKNKELSQQINKLKNDINSQFDGKENNINVDDDLSVEIINNTDTKAEDILRQNVSKQVSIEFNKLLAQNGLSDVVINMDKSLNIDDLDLDKIKNKQNIEQELRQSIRDKIYSQIDITIPVRD